MKADDGGRTIQTLERTLEIIEELRKRDGAAVSELAEAVDLTPSNVHHHLTTLRNEGFVVKEDGEYRLSMRFIILGGPARDRLSLFELGRDDIDRLAAETGETARLVVEQSGYGVTVYQSSGDRVRSHYGGLGHQESLHSTASGKAILAHASDQYVEEWVKTHGLPERTPNTITDRDELFDELETIRQENIAFDDQEHVEGRRCVSAPVFQNDRELLGSISLSASVDRKDPSWFESEAIDHLTNAAGVIRMFNTYSSWVDKSVS